VSSAVLSSVGLSTGLLLSSITSANVSCLSISVISYIEPSLPYISFNILSNVLGVEFFLAINYYNNLIVILILSAVHSAY